MSIYQTVMCEAMFSLRPSPRDCASLSCELLVCHENWVFLQVAKVRVPSDAVQWKDRQWHTVVHWRYGLCL